MQHNQIGRDNVFCPGMPLSFSLMVCRLFCLSVPVCCFLFLSRYAAFFCLSRYAAFFSCPGMPHSFSVPVCRFSFSVPVCRLIFLSRYAAFIFCPGMPLSFSVPVCRFPENGTCPDNSVVDTHNSSKLLLPIAVFWRCLGFYFGRSGNKSSDS